MLKAIKFSLRILFSGIILPFRIWQFSKDKLLSKAEEKSVKSLLDDDYIVTSWFDWTVDAIIFLVYHIGLIINLMGVLLGSLLWTILSLFGLFALIPLYFIPLILSFVRELGGSFMLLHMNVKRIRKTIEDGQD